MTQGVSIVMPVRDNAALTERCLATIASEPPVVPWELIVVDDGSTDRTPLVLSDLKGPMRNVRRETSGGFAVACNEGAAASSREWLLFLNNDTEPQAGWLDSLMATAVSNPHAAVVGSKLLFPDGTVQHAGVVFGQDGFPRHLYAGFPADHFAVNRERRVQAVTAACVLVRRDAFESIGGFDTAYRNGLEDVDLCLRLGRDGWEVRYCPTSVVVHLESATRGRRSSDHQDGERLYRERWRGEVRRDDLEHYVEDGLMRVRYSDSHPIEIEVSPLLAVSKHAGGDEAMRRLTRAFARRAAELLGDTVRLTTRMAELDLEVRSIGLAESKVEALPPAGGEASEQVLVELDRMQADLAELQLQLGFAGEATSYRSLIAGIQAAVDDCVPPGSTVLVISKGDDDLIGLGDRQALHFPQDEQGDYTGHHPSDSLDAIKRLERLRRSGAEFLVIPAASAWWLEHYDAFAVHLAGYQTIFDGPHCRIVSLRPAIANVSASAMVVGSDWQEDD
jgi:GT2 family glycosyltransferase